MVCNSWQQNNYYDVAHTNGAEQTYRDEMASSKKEHTSVYEKDNRTIYDIHDQIYNDTDLYPYVKQFKPKWDDRGAFYAIRARWLRFNHINMMASEAEAALQTSTHDSKKKVWNCKKYISYHVHFHIILMNLKEYEYQGSG